MFAVIESLGRQYKVSVGDVIHVDRISQENTEAPVGSPIVFTQVLMLADQDTDSGAQIGKPFVSGAQVLGEIVEQGKDKKVIAFKKKRRKGFKKKIGHRRQYSAVMIKEIKAA
jgi:large subunit ribosomal protein L21